MKRVIFIAFKNIFSLFLILWFNQNTFCQENDGISFYKNLVYVEFATKSNIYSVNYERIFFSGKKLTWSYRIGGFIGKDAIALPIGINLFTGKKLHHAELSFVATPYVDQYHTFLSKNDLSDKYLYLATTAGYRYQKPGGRFFGKVACGPLLFLDIPSDDFWNMEPKFYMNACIALGFSF